MSRIRSANTQPELIVRKYLTLQGCRYRIHYPVSGRPDIAFPRKKMAIFIHGCFWHMHNCRLGRVVPKTNSVFWKNKRFSNKIRDKKILKALEEQSWKVLVLWECQIEKNDKLESALQDFLKFYYRLPLTSNLIKVLIKFYGQ